jgi:hypothetical protein
LRHFAVQTAHQSAKVPASLPMRCTPDARVDLQAKLYTSRVESASKSQTGSEKFMEKRLRKHFFFAMVHVL